MTTNFDVIVIGGGHAGAEAAWAAAHLGARTALITFRRDAIGRMSCNPAIGGIGKGQMVREIDALGGLMGRVADDTGIQFRMLNRRKGPAVWSPRCQSDSTAYALAVQRALEHCPNLTILEAGVESFLHDSPVDQNRTHEQAVADAADIRPMHRIRGVILADGTRLKSEAVVVTSGTFLAALMHCGEQKTAGGRVGEPAAAGLSGALRELGLQLGRLKTGTPPRLARDSVNFSILEEQHGDDPPTPFSFLNDRIAQPQVCCWITYTNPAVHEILRANLHRAPMYSGQIQSCGPRYCPSIEDKIVRFADKEQHQIFLEPETRDGDRIYCNGISTSTPQDVQTAILKNIPGLENARVVQWGYAVEYDFVPPEQTDATLMTKRVAGLFLAGQINGTSGYEEAAGQGLIAGINAAHFVARRDPFILRRDEAYVGVMIDDLVTRGVTEPYRMFSSRAEHRMHLRYDNADQRLTPRGREIGLVDDARWARFERKSQRLAALLSILASRRVEGRLLVDWLRRPDESGERFAQADPELADFFATADVWAAALVQIRYQGYIERQARAIDEFRELEALPLPESFNYSEIPQLRREAVERLTAVAPRSLGQASRISGIRPTDLSLISLYLSAKNRLTK